MHIEQAKVLQHEAFAGDYRKLALDAPLISADALPGQFVHLHVPRLDAFVLRRPFSLYGAGQGAITILYKAVGKGTEAMTRVRPGEELSLIGPLGNGFPLDKAGAFPALVAGGYGVAPLFFLAGRLPVRGILFAGGRSARDILCLDDFRTLGWEVRVATEDGSLGDKGLVTGPLDRWTAGLSGPAPTVFACGPDGMLRAVSERAVAGNWAAWLSLDKHMGCGIGACLACVHKIRQPDGQAVWKRVCREGPVFEAREIIW